MASFIQHNPTETKPDDKFEHNLSGTETTTVLTPELNKPQATTSSSPVLVSAISDVNDVQNQSGVSYNKDPLHVAIEDILEENLADLYVSLSPTEQINFKRKGDETAGKIIDLLATTQATFKKIFNFILTWLKTIPGVNKFFLEQEAKIKADKIMQLKID
ncbi:MAG TPA: hypothetical protein PLH37_01805 [bacterium]|nr:hypothetical protein [bacterium]